MDGHRFHALLRRLLNVIIGLNKSDMPFRYSRRDLSLLVLSGATEAVESYCGVDNMSALFVNLTCEMDRRMSDQWGGLLLRHLRGFEGMHNVLDDIESSRLAWMCEVLGSRAAMN